MTRRFAAIAMTALLAATAPLAAQESESASPATALDLGQPVGTEMQLGDRYLKEQFGDWQLACIKTDLETDPCSLLQVLQDELGNSVAEVSLFRLSGGGQAVAGATIVVPLETLLPAQLTIAVDDEAGKRYGYTLCNQIGCVAQIGLTQADIDAYKRGSAATVSLVPAQAPDQRVELTMSLSGFTAGFDVVDVVANE